MKYHLFATASLKHDHRYISSGIACHRMPSPASAHKYAYIIITSQHFKASLIPRRRSHILIHLLKSFRFPVVLPLPPLHPLLLLMFTIGIDFPPKSSYIYSSFDLLPLSRFKSIPRCYSSTSSFDLLYASRQRHHAFAWNKTHVFLRPTTGTGTASAHFLWMNLLSFNHLNDAVRGKSTRPAPLLQRSLSLSVRNFEFSNRPSNQQSAGLPASQPHAIPILSVYKNAPELFSHASTVLDWNTVGFSNAS